MSLHLELGSSIEQTFPSDIDGPVENKQDILIVRLKNGVTLDVRYAAQDAYSLRWTYGDAESGIDTAPLHRGLASFPNHFHNASGGVVADTITRINASPEDNLHGLIRALLDDPMLGTRDIG